LKLRLVPPATSLLLGAVEAASEPSFTQLFLVITVGAAIIAVLSSALGIATGN
jgi:hypothetical protein